MSGVGRSADEGRADLHRARTIRKHDTMRDDYYQKKYRDMRRRQLKAPVWVSLLIYAVALFLLYIVFNGGLN